jgi:uncharacterized protein involved in exopolysaccharide biosynthesis
MFKYDHAKDALSPPNRRAADGAFGLADIPAAIWKRKYWPLLTSVALSGIVAVYSWGLPDRYLSTAQLLIDPRELRVLNSEVAPGGLSGDSMTAYLESQSKIITSTDMLRRIADREALAKDPEYNAGPTILERLLPVKQSGDKTIRIIEKLSRNLSVRRGERTFVVDIGVTATTPEKAARVANAFAAAYLEDQNNARGEQIRRTSNSLTSRLNALRDRVREAESKVESYKSKKNIVTASGKMVTEEQLLAASSALALARSRAADSKARLDQIESVRGQVSERGALPEAVNSTTMGILRQQLGEAQRRISNLSSSLGPAHPDFVAAQTQLREAQRGVADEINRIRQAARADYDRAINNEQTVQAQVDILKKDTFTSGRDNIELRELERELEASRVLYAAFLQRARESSELERLDTTNARIITTAVPSIDRVGPPRRVMVMSAAAGGFMLGLFLALALEFFGRFKRTKTYQRMTKGQSEASVEAGVAASTAIQHGPANAVASAPIQSNAAAYQTAPNSQATSSSQATANYQVPAAQSHVPSSQEQSTADLMRLLKMLGQLEKAIDQQGTRR